jgi:hypothetical protein
MGGACCLTNCQLYANDLVAYSRSFLSCPSRVVEEDKLRIKPPRIHGGKVEDAPQWLRDILAPPRKEEGQ